MKTCPFCAEEIQDAAKVCKHCRRDLPGEAPAWEAEARAFAAAGEKIKAIKKVREGGGTSLSEAKATVDSWGPATGSAAAIKPTGCGTWLVMLVLGLLLIGYCSSQNAPPSPTTSAPGAQPPSVPPTPAEPVLEILAKSAGANASATSWLCLSWKAPARFPPPPCPRS